jgi:hypothetical protein
MILLGNTMLFRADNGATGRELFSLAIGPVEVPPVPTPTLATSGGMTAGGSSGLSTAQLQQIFGVLRNTQPATSTSPARMSTAVNTTINSALFTRNLGTNTQLGTNLTGADVKELQKFLNAQGFKVSTIGAGSPGKETTRFGPATRRALIRFQTANNISPAVGYFGPVTRGVVIRMLNN